MTDEDFEVTRTAIGSGADDDAVRNDLLAAWLDDQAAGRERTLGDYQSLFPGRADLVAEEFAILTGEVAVPAGLRDAPEIPEVELQERIGSGGQGVVYRARQVYLERDVAVKVLSPSTWSEAFAARFQREAKTLASLRHANIVACYQAGVTDAGLGYMVMEFVDGPNLREWIAEHGPMPEATALRLCRDLARALEHAHDAGIIHRDVKPENVLLQPKPAAGDGFPFEVKLADLGLARSTARLVGDDALTQLTPVGAVMGSPRTMAPEQFDDPDGVDFRADVYGLGCVLYHAIAGRPAFGANTLTGAIKEKVGGAAPDLRAAATDARPEVAAFVAEMLAVEPTQRPDSHAAVAARCEELLGENVPRRPPSDLPWILLVAVLAAFFILDPLGFVYAPAAAVAAPNFLVNEGERASLLAKGSPDFTYQWREVSEHGVVLENADQAEATLVAPRGQALTCKFEVTVSNGWRQRVMNVRVRVQRDPALPPLEAGTVHDWLDADRVEDGWRAAGGVWAPNEPGSPRVVGYQRKGETTLVRDLPRGPFRVHGSVAPDEINHPARLGVRLLLSYDKTVELGLQPARAEWLAAVTANDGAPLAPTRSGWTESAPLRFTVEWRAGELVLRYGVGEARSWSECRLDRAALGTRWAPHTMVLFVRGGGGSFGRMKIEGL